MEDLNFTPDFSQEQKKSAGKRKNIAIDLNKSPQRRQKIKVKQHRPKILDASKPKIVKKEKVPKSKKTPKTPNATSLKKKLPKESKQSSSKLGLDLNIPPNNCPPEPKPKEKKARKAKNNVKTSRNAIKMELLGPKTPSSCIQEHLPHKRARLPRFYCRRSLNFNLENIIKDETDIQVGSVDGLRDGNIFNMLIVTLGLGGEDFGSSFGMRKIIEEYRRRNLLCPKALVNLLKGFPEELKKRRSTRRGKRLSFFPNLRNTIKLYNGQKVPTRKRSKTKKKAILSVVNPETSGLGLNLALSTFTPEANSTSLQNLSGPSSNEDGNLLMLQGQFQGYDDVYNGPTNYDENYLMMMQVGFLQSGHIYNGPPNCENNNSLMIQAPFRGYEDAYHADIDFLIKKLEYLQINDDFKQKAQQNIIHELVPYPMKIKRPKIHKLPKVDLDKETVQAWDRLMGNSTNEDTKEHDEEKEKWWEKEREIFRVRVDSLIARMHHIQGSRKFSQWKGSVVDSVVGVYLTQNVSDNLSSSAFMSLASRFPAVPHAHQNDCCGDIEFSQKSAVEVNITSNSRITQTSVQGEEILSSAGYFDCSLNEKKSTLTSNHEGDNEANIKLKSATKPMKKKPKMKAKRKTEEKKKRKKKTVEKKKINWDEIKRIYSKNRPRPPDTMDYVDWSAVRHATVEEVAQLIAKRGQQNILAGRIKKFLDLVAKDNIDLEWLRDVPPHLVKKYLSEIHGLGLKSVECIRLLALQHHAFPVDTNVGRIAVRLGWVPLQPLPEDLEIDLLKQYPILDSIQKYLWPRLCMLDQQKLYELHYQLITFGKVFCTKSRPNCNACPLKAECRHFASAYARAKLRLPAPQEKRIVTTNNPCTIDEDLRHREAFPLISLINSTSDDQFRSCEPIVEFPKSPRQVESCGGEPVVELPQSPEQESVQQFDIKDIEDLCNDSDDEILTIRLDTEELKATILKVLEKNTDFDKSKALILITPEASIPTPKLKIVGRLRTVHNVYKLEDGHRLLQTFPMREIDDPCPYLFAIQISGDSTHVQEKNNDEVSGSILVPCRTANKGKFPLNGTYFQVNEVFADEESSECPIRISRKELCNLNRRALYCGTSTTTIMRGMDTQEIQYCFWKGFVCIRGWNKRTGAPRPLPKRFRPPGGPSKDFKEEFEYDDEY